MAETVGFSEKPRNFSLKKSSVVEKHLGITFTQNHTKRFFLVRKKVVFLEAVRNLERDNCDTHLLKNGMLFNLANC